MFTIRISTDKPVYILWLTTGSLDTNEVSTDGSLQPAVKYRIQRFSSVQTRRYDPFQGLNNYSTCLSLYTYEAEISTFHRKVDISSKV